MQARYRETAAAKDKNNRDREASAAAKHSHLLKIKEAELTRALEESAHLQALVNRFAASRAELKDLNIRLK
jgi:hypothetical protein